MSPLNRSSDFLFHIFSSMFSSVMILIATSFLPSCSLFFYLSVQYDDTGYSFSLYILQIDRDMLMSGYIQPIPDLSPVIPSVDEIPSVDPDVSPYETNIVSFYKTWDIFGAFSNFSPHPISMPDENGDSITWLTVEHYYQVLLHLFSLLHVCFSDFF